MAEPSVAAPAQAARRVVSVRDLVVDFVQDTGTTRALAGICLDLHAGRVLGVVGESGCGKRSVGNIGALRHRPPPSWPRPRDIISHTRTPAAPGADGTGFLQVAKELRDDTIAPIALDDDDERCLSGPKQGRRMDVAFTQLRINETAGCLLRYCRGIF
jgi:hypothetical protein